MADMSETFKFSKDNLKAANEAHQSKTGKKSAFMLRGNAKRMYTSHTSQQIFNYVRDAAAALKQQDDERFLKGE